MTQKDYNWCIKNLKRNTKSWKELKEEDKTGLSLAIYNQERLWNIYFWIFSIFAISVIISILVFG